MPSTTTKPYQCSFCGKLQSEVAQLIAGPSVFICDECVDLSASIINERRKQKATETLPANDEPGQPP